MTVIHEKIHIQTRGDRIFKDREEAGRALAAALKEWEGSDALVLGIPRGGILVARALAQALGIGYDILLSRKIRSPWNPEFAIGAVGEDGRVFINEREYSSGDAVDEYVQREIEQQKREIATRAANYRNVFPEAHRTGRTVIVTDDGLATGSTMQAALIAVQAQRPRKLIAAVPVAPEDAVRSLEPHADEVWCLAVPEFFAAVGQAYAGFEQVSDEQVLQVLSEARRKNG